MAKDKSALSEFRRLSGAGDQFGDWKSPGELAEDTNAWVLPKKANLTESRQAPLPTPAPRKKGVTNLRIRSMARFLDEGGMSGGHLPSFDDYMVEGLFDSLRPKKKDTDALTPHLQAIHTSDHVHKNSNASDHVGGHALHSHAANLHKSASAAFKQRAKEDPAHAEHLQGMADVHDKWSKHHTDWVNHHETEGGKQKPAAKEPASGKAKITLKRAAGDKKETPKVTPEKDPFPSEKKKAAPKVEPEKDPFPADKSKTSKSTGHIAKDPFPDEKKAREREKEAGHTRVNKGTSDTKVAAPGSKEHDDAVASTPKAQLKAHLAKKIAAQRDSSKDDATHQDRRAADAGAKATLHYNHGSDRTKAASESDKASKEHLQTALHHFHSGNHEKALASFNAAIHHSNKHSKIKSELDAQARQKERHAAPRGPQTTVGRTRVAA